MPEEQKTITVCTCKPVPEGTELPPDSGFSCPPLPGGEEASGRMSPPGGLYYQCSYDGWVQYVPGGMTWWRCPYGHLWYI